MSRSNLRLESLPGGRLARPARNAPAAEPNAKEARNPARPAPDRRQERHSPQGRG